MIRRRSDNLRPQDRSVLDELIQTNIHVYCGWLLIDELRAVYLARSHGEAMRLLDEWISAACVSELEPFIPTALTIDTHPEHITNAITLGPSNARLEGMNSTVRRISHRDCGYNASHHSSPC